MAFDVQAAIAKAAEQGPDMNEAQKGGGPPELPAPGLTRLRLISYIELGQHEEEFKGEKKVKELVYLAFELSGPKHPPENPETGRTKPFIISFTTTLSLNEKANFYKLFKRLNHTGEYRHFAQLLGKDFLGTVVHETRGEGADAKTYANLRDDSGFTIRPPFVEDPESGESRRVTVDEPRTPLQCFIWDFADKEMWDSIFIDGRWDDKKDKDGKVIKEGASKNYFQNRIRAAKNFTSSPLAAVIAAGGEPDLPGAETPERSEENKQATADSKAGADADPLAGM